MQEVTEIALNKLTEEFNNFIQACMDEKGEPKAPTKKDLMRARGCMPPRCSTSLQKSKSNGKS